MSKERRRELGDNEFPVEEDLQEAMERTMRVGADRLHRTFRAMVITGLFGGMEIGLGVMAYLAVLHGTGNQLLAGVAFSVGLVALLLARSELFTEDFLMPVAAVVAREASLKQLGKLWAATLGANLVGAWVFMWLVMQAFPEWKDVVTESAKHFVEAPFSLQSVCLALLAGSTITLMTRMQEGTKSDPTKVVATIIGGFLLAGLQLFHSVLDSLLIFGAIHAGADISYLQWLGWFAYTLAFNILGGIVLVTVPRLIRTKELIEIWRRESPENPDAPHENG